MMVYFGACPWSWSGFWLCERASVDVFTSLGLKDTTSPISVNYFTRTKLALYENPTKKSTPNLPKSPNFDAFDLGLERTSELVQGGKSTGTDLFDAAQLLVWLDEAVSMVQ
jgi:hypothetical protein